MAEAKALTTYDPNQGQAMMPAGGSTEIKVFENEFNLAQMLHTAGKLKLNKDQLAVLDAPVNPDDVEIRPDGLIYLPWMEYATRLKKAFGVGGWALVPHGLPAFKNNYILWGFSLVVQGHYCGYALGEQDYFPNNRTMSWGDACEGAKSNALMRLCKGIGISLELWQPSFIREWKEKYAETYKAENKQTGKWRTMWRKKKAATPEGGEPGTQPQTEGTDSVVDQEGNGQTSDNNAQAPEQPQTKTEAMVEGFMKLRSGPSLIKWVKDHATNLVRMPMEDAKKLKAKWDRFQKDGKIDKELNLRAWVEKHADMSLLEKKEETPVQEHVEEVVTPEVVEEMPEDAKLVQDTFGNDPGPKQAQQFDHLVHEAVKASAGAKGVTYEAFDMFFKEQWESKGDKYKDINMLKAQVVAKGVFKNAWQAFMMWLPEAILKGKVEVK